MFRQPLTTAPSSSDSEWTDTDVELVPLEEVLARQTNKRISKRKQAALALAAALGYCITPYQPDLSRGFVHVGTGDLNKADPYDKD